jgi:hypothetical protein
MVRRSAGSTSAQETHQDDLLHPCCVRGGNNVSGRFDVHSFIRLLANLTIDACTMSNGVTARERFTQDRDLVKIACYKLHSRRRFGRLFFALPACQENHVMSLTG